MQAARLRTRVAIERPVYTTGTMGENVESTPTALGSFWVEILAAKGRELETLQQTWAEARFNVRMRHQPDVALQRADRIVWGTRTLDILDVEDPDQRRRELNLICREIVA